MITAEPGVHAVLANLDAALSAHRAVERIPLAGLIATQVHRRPTAVVAVTDRSREALPTLELAE